MSLIPDPSEEFLNLPYQPEYEREVLKQLNNSQLKIICKEWGIRHRSRISRSNVITEILNHENNVNPEWVEEFDTHRILQPDYTKAELKHLTLAELEFIGTQWRINYDDMSRRQLIRAILRNPRNNLDYRDPDDPHDLEGVRNPAWDTDAEPEADDDKEDDDYSVGLNENEPTPPLSVHRPSPNQTPSPSPPIILRHPRRRRDYDYDSDPDPSDEDSDISGAISPQPPLNRRRNRRRQLKMKDVLAGLVKLKDISKLTVKISGSPGENLPNKIFELENFQKITNCKDEKLWMYLTIQGLTGEAKNSYKNERLLNSGNVDTYSKLVSFLFDRFSGDQFADDQYKKLVTLRQNNDSILDYWHKFRMAVNEYKYTVRTIRKYKSHPDPLLRELSSPEIYTKFINSLNNNSRVHVRSFIQLYHVDKDINAIVDAIMFAEQMLHPKHGIRSTNNIVKRQINNSRFGSRGRPNNRGRSSGNNGQRNVNRNENRFTRNRAQSRSRSRNPRDNNNSNNRIYRNRDNDRNFRDRNNERRQFRDNRNQFQRRIPIYRNQNQPINNNTNNERKKNINCFNCGQLGHYANKCPNKNKPNTATVPRKSKSKDKGKDNNDNKQVHWLDVRNPPNYRQHIIDHEYNEELDNIHPQSILLNGRANNRHVHFMTNNNNCNNHNNFNSNNRRYRRRYIFFLSTINTTATGELDLNSPFTAELRFNNYSSSRPNGMYLGYVDTGSNTPAMSTEFVKKQKFPIYPVKRSFSVDTANDPVIVKYATVLELENTNEQNEKYWMKTIFYLFDKLRVDIVIDRRLIRLMNLLGDNINKLNTGTFTHKATASNVLTDNDDVFFDQLIDPNDILPIKQTTSDNYSDSDVDYTTRDHDPDDLLDNEYTIEGDSMAKALFRSTFETTNSSTKTGADDDNKNNHNKNHTYDPIIDNTIGDTKDNEILIIDKPLNVNKSTTVKKHIVVDEDDYIIDEFANHTYGDTIADDNSNTIDEELKLDAEDDEDLVKLPKPLLNRKPLSELYKHTKFINTTVEMEKELLDKYYKQTIQRLDYPDPPSLYKMDPSSIARRQIYPIQVSEDVIDCIGDTTIVADDIRREFNRILKRYKDTIARTWADCGKIEGVYLKLDLKPGAKPFKYAPYKSSFEQLDEIDEQCNQLLEAGFIIPSNSNFASPVLMVPKKIVGNKPLEWRMCIDYRRLNSMTIKDHYPLPNIQSIYRKFAGNHYFSSLDLRHACHHIEIRPQDRHKTAFITHKGLFEWVRMTFGFSNAPAAFQRAINYIFRDLDFVIIYLDDILILSKTEAEHIKHLRLVFQRLSEYNLKLRIDKCKFFAKELKYLGFILDAYGIRPDPAYIDKVIELRIPTDKKSLQRVLGMINWLHRYIPRLSDYIWPLTRLTRKNIKFEWNNECNLAFIQIKKMVKNTQILRHPDLTQPFYVVCDASNFGIGAVLMQKHGNTLHPCEYWSKLFGDNEKHWHVSEKELSAIVYSLEKWRKYLLGRHFYVFTDHKNLETLHTKFADKTLNNQKLLRWLIRMEPFDFTCYYIKGIHNVAADYLSRDVCMESAQNQRDKVNNNHSMDYSVLLNRKSIHFIEMRKSEDCVDTYHVIDNGKRKQIHTLNTPHVLYDIHARRRSKRLLAKRQKAQALKRLDGKPRNGNTNEISNRDHHSQIRAGTIESTAGCSGLELAGRPPRLSHSGGVGNDKRRAASDGFGSDGKVREPNPIHDGNRIGRRDVVIDRKRVNIGMDNREVFTNDDDVSVSEHDKAHNRFVIDADDEIDLELDDTDEYDRNIKRIFDIKFNAVINRRILYNALMDDAIFGTILRVLLDRKRNESLLYTLPKFYQREIFDNLYILKGNLLYYVVKRAYIIPPRLRHPIMDYFHKSLHTLHQGVERMLNLMKDRVYWPNISNDVRQYVDGCISCKIGKATPNRREGFLQLFPVHKPFEIVHMDIVGPLPVTRSGNRYILTIMDRYSRLVKLVPLPITTASCICLAFRDNWILQFGVPDNVLTDRGSYFTGLLFRVLSKIFGFDLKFTTSYHPKTNGRLERFHRYLKERLRVLAKELGLDFLDSDDWDIYLPNIAFSYNITPNRMNRYSPYQIIYDEWIKLPIDRILGANIDDVVDEQLNYFKNPRDARLKPRSLDAEQRAGIIALRQRRKHLQKEIQQTKIKYDQKRKQVYDRNRVTSTHYKPNQEVWVDISVAKVGNVKKLGINRKKAHIIDQLGENTYVVEYENGKVEPVNVDRLYTVIRESNNDDDDIKPIKKGKQSYKNYKKRRRNRDKRNGNNSQPPYKKRRLHTNSLFDSGRGEY